MSFTPSIIINRKELQEKLPILYDIEFSEKSDDVDKQVANYLYKVFDGSTVMTFGDLELIMCQPEFSEFNGHVRDKLTELDIYHQLSY